MKPIHPGDATSRAGSSRLPLDPERFLRRLCAGVVALAVVEFVVATTGVQIRRLPHSTDFATYYLAAAQARDGLSPYDRAAIAARGHALGFAHDQFPFLYPPPFALALEPLAALPYPRARQVWMVVSTVALLAAVGATAMLVRRHAASLALAGPYRAWIVFAAFVPAALNSTSVHNDVRAGSVGVFLYLLLAIVACTLLERPGPHAAGRGQVLAGAAVAAATLCKLVPAALVPWLWWRGRRRAAMVAVALLALSMVPALLHWGPGIVRDYWQRGLAPCLVDEAAPPMNQSLDAVLSRLLVPSIWVRPPFVAPGLKRVLSFVLSLAVVAATLRTLARRRRAPALLPVEMGLVVLALLVVMKLTWVHTLAALLFAWPCLYLAILRAAERDAPWARRAGLAACAGFFLSSAHVPILWGGLRQGPLVIVTGVHLAGILILWATSIWVLAREGEVAMPWLRSSGDGEP